MNYNEASPNALDSQKDDFVKTLSAQKHLRLMALSLSASVPLLLEGPMGCGKTSLVASLARATGNYPQLLKIHLCEQTDVKALLGTYVCTDVPGGVQSFVR
jgi:midasin